MLEGQVDELALHAGQAAVGAAVDQGARRAQRLRVAGEGPCAAAKDVARELVEHEDACQRALRRGGPAVELAGQRALDQAAEEINALLQ